MKDGVKWGNAQAVIASAQLCSCVAIINEHFVGPTPPRSLQYRGYSGLNLVHLLSSYRASHQSSHCALWDLCWNPTHSLPRGTPLSHTYLCVLNALVSPHCLRWALFYCSLSTFTHAGLSLRPCFLPSALNFLPPSMCVQLLFILLVLA